MKHFTISQTNEFSVERQGPGIVITAHEAAEEATW